jgi:hypothetical protein
MNLLDDDDLIDRLQSAIAEHQSGISAPQGIGGAARRAARKRTATWVLGVAPVLAAAGVAIGLAASSGSGPTGTRAAGAGGSALSAPTDPVKTQHVAYIIKRVRAKVADGRGGIVIRSYTYDKGDVSMDGSLVNLGTKIAEEYDYAAADGITYTRTAWIGRDGSAYLTGSNVLVPDADNDGRGIDTRTLVDPVTRTYSQSRFAGVSSPVGGQLTPNLDSSASEVQRALSKGQVTETGTATIAGTHAIALSIRLPNLPGAGDTHLTMYVDAQSYQPLRTVETLDGAPDLQVADWMPATPDNVLQAKNDLIPAGYTKVAQVS